MKKPLNESELLVAFAEYLDEEYYVINAEEGKEESPTFKELLNSWLESHVSANDIS